MADPSGNKKLPVDITAERRKADRISLTDNARYAILLLLLSLSRDDLIFFYTQLKGRL